MGKQEKKAPKEYPQSSIKYRLRKIFSSAAKIIGILATITGIIGGCIKIDEYFLAEPDIKGSFARYKVAGVVSYSGELINESSRHAKELTLKGKFNSKIIDIVITTNDILEKNLINNPAGSVEFVLKRLSGKNKCQFDIIVAQESEIIEHVQVSWGEKGRLELNPQKSDENIKRGIELREKLSDLSFKARQKWLENNAKNIRK